MRSKENKYVTPCPLCGGVGGHTANCPKKGLAENNRGGNTSDGVCPLCKTTGGAFA